MRESELFAEDGVALLFIESHGEAHGSAWIAPIGVMSKQLEAEADGWARRVGGLDAEGDVPDTVGQSDFRKVPIDRDGATFRMEVGDAVCGAAWAGL